MGFFGGAKTCDRSVSNDFVKSISGSVFLLFIFLVFTGDPSSLEGSSETVNDDEISNCYGFFHDWGEKRIGKDKVPFRSPTEAYLSPSDTSNDQDQPRNCALKRILNLKTSSHQLSQICHHPQHQEK